MAGVRLWIEIDLVIHPIEWHSSRNHAPDPGTSTRKKGRGNRSQFTTRNEAFQETVPSQDNKMGTASLGCSSLSLIRFLRPPPKEEANGSATPACSRRCIFKFVLIMTGVPQQHFIVDKPRCGWDQWWVYLYMRRMRPTHLLFRRRLSLQWYD